jgi:hypothetical protein
MDNKPKTIRDLSLIQLYFPDTEKLKNLLTNIILSRDAISHVVLDDSLKTISRRFDHFPLKEKALYHYTNNKIQLLSNKETIKIPTFLPAWRVASPLGINVYFNATPYVPISDPTGLDIRKLFGFLVYSCILIDTYNSWDKIIYNNIIIKNSANIYAKMIHKVIDRLTGIGMDRLRSDQIKYVFAKYFLINMIGRVANDTVDSIASTVILGTGLTALADFETTFASSMKIETQSELYHLNFLEFITGISKSVSWLDRLNTRNFLQTFTSMFGSPILLAAEDATYLLASIGSHQVGSDIISSYNFDGIYGKEGDLIIDEFARLIR